MPELTQVLAEAFEALHDGVALIDGSGRVEHCNARFTELTGWSDVQGARPLLREVLPALTELRAEPTAILVGARRVEAARRELSVGAAIVLTDVTATRRAEEAERSSARMMEAILESAPVGIVLVDPELRVRMWSGAARNIFGWTAEEVVGQPYTMLVPDDQLDTFDALVAQVRRGEGAVGVPTTRRHRRGHAIPVALSTAPVRDPEGRFVGTLVMLEDRTARLRLEEQVRQVDRMEAVGRLAGGIAHDFNNLLMVILGACDQLVEEPETDPQEFASDVRRAAERASELTHHLLAYSRRAVLTPTHIDLTEVVRDGSAMVKRLLGDAIELRLVPSSHPLPVLTDRVELERMLLNLALNARDAMPNGGSLRIGTRALSGDNGGWAELSVADSGTGIAPEHLPYIFEPFFTTKRAEGTGLGLATVYGFVQQSGGRILVESKPGVGTTFRVHLPTVGIEDAPPPREPTPVGGVPPRARILLVEDEVDVRVAIHRLLTNRGYDVLVAADGAQAIEIAEGFDGPIHLLLTDVVMPPPNGREVAARVSRRRPDTPILFMSGYTDDPTWVGAEGHGFIQKPFTANALDQRIRELLGLPG